MLAAPLLAPSGTEEPERVGLCKATLILRWTNGCLSERGRWSGRGTGRAHGVRRKRLPCASASSIDESQCSVQGPTMSHPTPRASMAKTPKTPRLQAGEPKGDSVVVLESEPKLVRASTLPHLESKLNHLTQHFTNARFCPKETRRGLDPRE
jgi:hypothetical protein